MTNQISEILKLRIGIISFQTILRSIFYLMIRYVSTYIFRRTIVFVKRKSFYTTRIMRMLKMRTRIFKEYLNYMITRIISYEAKYVGKDCLTCLALLISDSN